MKRVYLSAPMTGVPDLNREWFTIMEELARAKGYEVVTPLSVVQTNDWLDMVIQGLQALKTCDIIFLHPDWEKSAGCRVEETVARRIGLKILHSR